MGVTMNTIQAFDVIDKSLLDGMIQDYYSRTHYDTSTMNKAPPGQHLLSLHKIIEEIMEIKLVYKIGNFYKHNVPYLPHTDYKTYLDNTINVVIPLSYTDSLPHLIIFDQKWEQDSVTWCMQYPVQYFEFNIGVKGSPHEYPVKGLTGQDIDEQLYTDHLSQYTKDTLFGLSGEAYPFEPGSIMLFDNKRIHGTSRFTGEKLGITLRFKPA